MECKVSGLKICDRESRRAGSPLLLAAATSYSTRITESRTVQAGKRSGGEGGVGGQWRGSESWRREVHRERDGTEIERVSGIARNCISGGVRVRQTGRGAGQASPSPRPSNNSTVGTDYSAQSTGSTAAAASWEAQGRAAAIHPCHANHVLVLSSSNKSRRSFQK